MPAKLGGARRFRCEPRAAMSVTRAPELRPSQQRPPNLLFHFHRDFDFCTHREQVRPPRICRPLILFLIPYQYETASVFYVIANYFPLDLLLLHVSLRAEFTRHSSDSDALRASLRSRLYRPAPSSQHPCYPCSAHSYGTCACQPILRLWLVPDLCS